MGFTFRVNMGPLLLAVCGACATRQHDSVVERSSGEGSASKAPPAANQVTLPQVEPPRSGSVHIENVAPGRFVLDATAEVNIAMAASLERRSADGEWTPEPYELRDTCAAAAGGASGCRVLRPGAPFSPLSWNGTPCGPCCAEQEPTPIEPGMYRLMLSACDEPGDRWQGPSVEMPGATDAVERWRAIAHVQKASLFELGASRTENEKGHDDHHIVGYPIRAGSEVVLSTSLVAALSEWLRDSAGFSAAVMRRCISGKRFGFRLERDVPRLGAERPEIAVELNCRSIVVANQEGSQRIQSYSYFDYSQQALLAILQQAMPGAALTGRQR